MACAVDCDINIIDNPTDGCTTTIRRNSFKRFHFKPCNVSIPYDVDGKVDATALEALYEANAIVRTSELANVTPQAPTTQETAISDCRPALVTIDTREIQFQDRISIQLNQGSPAVLNRFYDYAFWASIMTNMSQLDVFIEYCDGDVVIAKDVNSNLLPATLFMYLDWERASTQGGKSVEFKNGSLRFQGDPFALDNPPSFNIASDGTITPY